MMLKSYNVTLTRLTKNDLETVRMWRNSPQIQQTMVFRKYITKTQQLSWFKTLRDKHDYYFIVNYENQPSGVANLKSIDFNRSCAEAGIFIYKQEHQKINGFAGVLTLYNFAFEHLTLSYVLATVLDDNKRAIRFNEFLGYTLIEKQHNDTSLYKLTKENYLRRRRNIEKYL